MAVSTEMASRYFDVYEILHLKTQKKTSNLVFLSLDARQEHYERIRGTLSGRYSAWKPSTL